MKRLLTIALLLVSGMLLGATPNDGTTSSGGNEFKLQGGYFTEDSREPLRNLERMRNVGHIPPVFFSPAAEHAATASGDGTVNSLVDTGEFTPNALVGMKMRINGVDGSYVRGDILTVTGNTANDVFFSPAAREATSTGDTYEIWDGVLPPGHDTNGTGSAQRPYQTFSSMSKHFKEPVRLMLDCAEFKSSRDAGGVFELEATGGTITTDATVCADSSRICNMISTPKACGRKPSRITFDTDQTEFGFIHLANGITTGIENIISSGPYDPQDGHDFIRQNAGYAVTLNTGFDRGLGYFNQLNTAHADGSSVILNAYGIYGDETPLSSKQLWELRRCHPQPGYKRDHGDEPASRFR